MRPEFTPNYISTTPFVLICEITSILKHYNLTGCLNLTEDIINVLLEKYEHILTQYNIASSLDFGLRVWLPQWMKQRCKYNEVFRTRMSSSDNGWYSMAATYKMGSKRGETVFVTMAEENDMVLFLRDLRRSLYALQLTRGGELC